MNLLADQQTRNQDLLRNSPHLGCRIESMVLPFTLDLKAPKLTAAQIDTLAALEKKAAATALSSLASLAKINELDHLGGGLELIPSLLMTLAITDYKAVHYTVEHAHTSIGYYSSLAALGFLEQARVVDHFRRSLDIAGHVSWVPGGTQLNGGRLGVMVPVAVGQAIGLKADHGAKALVVCHCGDAGWISGQALNGFNAADIAKAPVVFIMHRNGIQLSGTTSKILNKDPRPIIRAMGVDIIEVKSLHDRQALYAAYRKAAAKARAGRPVMIYPTGSEMPLADFGKKLGITADLAHFAAKHKVPLKKKVWVPGSLMSFRDVHPMMECVFLVNGLPGGEGHHDGHMKGRDLAQVLANPMLTTTPAEQKALAALGKRKPRVVVTEARPGPGAPNLLLTDAEAAAAELPGAGKKASARAGSQAAYGLLAKKYPKAFFNVSCDLDPSTKLDKAATFLDAGHNIQLSIEEQIATLVANGIGMSGGGPKLPVVATFAAFFEGIAREGMELWRYQRNLTGVNEGVNVVMHLSHVGANTGRDHFSGWSLDWITLAMGYLPYLHRFYAPADARSAFVAVRDCAAHYGAHIVAIPRDNLPVLVKQDGSGPVFNPADAWEPVTTLRTQAGARKAVLAFGATAYLAVEASEKLAAAGTPVDAYVVNGLPFNDGQAAELARRYPGGLVTVEDGIIAHEAIGLRGFASLVASSVAGLAPVRHIGILDPRIAPSEGHPEVWEHFGITAATITASLADLG
ncbi:MAG: thiamine pyrophosphate-dependent enzyme [Kiritimatiellia bacterium]